MSLAAVCLGAAVLLLLGWLKGYQAIKCWMGLHDMHRTHASSIPFHVQCRDCGRLIDLGSWL